MEGVLQSGQVILGEHTRRFEEAFAAACGRRYAVAVSSDTAAFEILLRIFEVEGKPVIFPALAFSSILESVHNAGGLPVFVDASLEHHLFPTVEQVIDTVGRDGRVPGAVILMHTGGLLARDSVHIADWCSDERIPLLEDAAHAFGARLGLEMAGQFGVASAFSLYATKPMHACEGGIIVTDNETVANDARLYRNYGRGQDFGRSVVVRHGSSWRMTEIQAIIGRSNLEFIEPNLAARHQVMDRYDMLRRERKGVWDRITDVPLYDGMIPNGYRYLLLLPEGYTEKDRTQMKAFCSEAGVDLPGEVYELPAHKQPVWRQYGDQSMPVAEDFCRRHFSLPVYPAMIGKEEQVVETVERGLAEIGLS